ncbi:MAG: RNA polymerase II elongation factor [Cirrosporium novae-zelandiae]|nr:MAG: RNA polymerase II elongation factor [Cirrosporium novae-zelandiae]
MPSPAPRGLEAREIETRAKALQKAFHDKAPAPHIITIMRELKEGVVATEEVLRVTKVGVIVNRMKHHQNPEVTKLASEIVSKWRGDVERRKKSGTPSSSRVNGTGSSSASTPTAEKKFYVAPDKRSWKADGVDISRTGDRSRDACIGLLYDGLCLNTEAAPSVIMSHALSVEKEAHAKHGTGPDYKSKMRSLYQNLKNKSNPKLRIRILSGEVSAARFITMSHDELKSDQHRAEDEKIKRENLDKAMVAKAEKSISTSLSCGKCGQKKVSYSQAQTRSADEPMTTFCECTICGNRWKVSMLILELEYIFRWLMTIE